MGPDVVIGGGPSGAAAACTLAAAGRRVLLLERTAGPAQKVCGDFLSAGSLRSLSALGIDAASLGAEPVGAMRLVLGSRRAEGRLPFRAAGLSRARLDEALLARAAALGAELQRGVSVRRLRDGAIETDRAGEIRPAAAFLATGKHDLRGARRRTEPGDLVGLKMYFDPHPAARADLRGFVEIALFRDGYAGLQLVEGGRLNLCALVRRRRLEECGGSWHRLLPALLAESPHLARRLADARPCLERPLAVAGLPYGFVHRAAEGDASSVYRVGDQMGVIPSLAGDGIAIALRTGRQAAADRLAGRGAAAYHRRLRRALIRPVGLAGVVHALCLSRHQEWAVAASRAMPGLIGMLAAWTRSGAALR